MAKAKRSLRASTRSDSGEQMVAAAGVRSKALTGVSRLTGGRLKMVGARHDARLGMTLPAALVDAWKQLAEETGVTSTDLFEDSMLRYLKKNGWDIGV